MDINDEFYFDLKWRFFFKLSREKRARRVHFNDIPTRKIGKIFYLAIILEALTVRSVSRVNSLKIRIAVRFSCRIKRIKGLNLWSAKESIPRASPNRAYLTPCRWSLLTVYIYYIVALQQPTYQKPVVISSYLHTPWNTIWFARQYARHLSNIRRTLIEMLKSFLCDFRVSKSIRKIFKPRCNEARAQRGTERDLNLLKKLFPANKRLSREFES